MEFERRDAPESGKEQQSQDSADAPQQQRTEERGKQPAVFGVSSHGGPSSAERGERACREDSTGKQFYLSQQLGSESDRPAEGGGFCDHHLADVLCNIFTTRTAITGLLSALKDKDKPAFRAVKASSTTEGRQQQLFKEQIAQAITECRPGEVADAGGLLSWLIKVHASTSEESYVSVRSSFLTSHCNSGVKMHACENEREGEHSECIDYAVGDTGEDAEEG